MRYIRDRFEFMGVQQPNYKHSHPSVTKIYTTIKYPKLPLGLVLCPRHDSWQKI